MSESVPIPAAVTGSRRGDATRARILDAATELIYANGIRSTSADRIIEQAGITKVTFYRHFKTKTDLVVAYLERQSAGEREARFVIHPAVMLLSQAATVPGFPLSHAAPARAATGAPRPLHRPA